MRDEFRPRGKSVDITDDIVFEIELLKQIEINIDYILMLVKKYRDSKSKDKEVVITINKAVNASPELRSKKDLIESFISSVNDTGDVFTQWKEYISEKRESELSQIIEDERLKEQETRQFIKNAFRSGEVKTIGGDIDRLMPPMSRFGGGNRAKKKQGIIDKLKAFFERFSGISVMSEEE